MGRKFTDVPSKKKVHVIFYYGAVIIFVYLALVVITPNQMGQNCCHR